MNKTVKKIKALKLSPVTLMDIVYGEDYFFLSTKYDIEGEDIIVASRYGHAGEGCLPGMAAAIVHVAKIDNVHKNLYRYKLSSIDVFEPFECESQDTLEVYDDLSLNMLDDTENIAWQEEYLYPKIKGAYINYLGEWAVPYPQYE